MAKITCSIGSKSSGSGPSPNVKSEIGNIHVWLVICMCMCISVQIAKVYIRRSVPSTDQALPSCFYFRIS